MTAIGASRPLRRIPAIVSFLNPQPALSLVGGNRSSCPKAVIASRPLELWELHRQEYNCEASMARRHPAIRGTHGAHAPFAFDRSATDPSPRRRLRPVGLSWGNDHGFTPADQQAGKKLTETIISDQAPQYAASHLGWAGRANGPVDNPISGCLSCHSTAQSPAAPITFTNTCTTDAQKMLWFRDLQGTHPFGAVDAMCNPITSGPAPSPLDFSLQMSVAVQNFVQFGDVNPCSPSISVQSVPSERSPGEHPLIARLIQIVDTISQVLAQAVFAMAMTLPLEHAGRVEWRSIARSREPVQKLRGDQRRGTPLLSSPDLVNGKLCRIRAIV
jgi:hypothetical protein